VTVLASQLTERVREVPRVALTPAEAAESLGCSAEFFREHVDHELRWIRRGRKRFVPLSELERWAVTNAERTL
jgi:excisionase family DNA binding protein